jgi:hypothetical protein
MTINLSISDRVTAVGRLAERFERSALAAALSATTTARYLLGWMRTGDFSPSARKRRVQRV